MEFKELEGTVTNDDLCIAFNQDKKRGTVLLKTPEGKIISLSDAEVDLQDDEGKSIAKIKKGIHLKFGSTEILLNEKGITLRAKKITIESTEDVVEVNQSTFNKK